MGASGFLELRDRILAVAEDSHNHILDRIDAYLELAILFQKDARQSFIYIGIARDLIRRY